MKEFHIISSGVSLIQNAQKSGIIPLDKKISDEAHWKNLLDNPLEINRLKDFITLDPYKNSAELNTFLRVVKDKDPSQIEVYLFGTKTFSNELCRTVIQSFLRERGYLTYTPYEVSGYFWEACYFDNTYAKDKFQKGVSELLDRLIYLARKKINDGYKVYFNPTGGLKAHVIATALAGFLLGSDVYYMNEEFNEVVFIPKLFYLPKGREVEILKKIESKILISGSEASSLYESEKEALERLNLYNLVQLEEDNQIYRIRITHKGLLFLKFLKELKE
ncbi:MAG: putative CRISPR-associated protein [Thermodesulfovibrionales bacterium]|nr:putative CRISPR-associated protein [Thermodesulfovibrionales bacterium]